MLGHIKRRFLIRACSYVCLGLAVGVAGCPLPDEVLDEEPDQTAKHSPCLEKSLDYLRHTMDRYHGEASYFNAAERLGRFIQGFRNDTCEDESGQKVGGFTLGLDDIEAEEPERVNISSAEHNIDVYAAFEVMHNLTDESDAALQLAEKRAEQTQQVSEFQAAMLSGIDVEAMGRGIKERFREQVRAALERQYVGEFPNRRKRTPEEVEAELAAFDQRAGAAQAVDVARRVMDEFVLARAADALEEKFADQPLVRAQLHFAIGTTYRDLGLYDAAEPHLRAALEIRQRELGDEHPDTLTSISEMGYVLWKQHKLGEAESCYREALEGRRRVLGDEHPATLTSIHNIGYLLWAQGKPTEAEPYYREVLEGRRRVLGDEHPEPLTVMHNMGLVLRDQGRLAEAERYFREVLEKSRPILGDEHPGLLPTIHALASALHAQGKWEGGGARGALGVGPGDAPAARHHPGRVGVGPGGIRRGGDRYRRHSVPGAGRTSSP